MRKIMSLFAAAAILAFLTTHALSEEGPKGWLLRGVSTNDYIIGIDSHTFHSGARSGYIEYTTHPMIIRHGFGTLMQACKAEQYSGKRIRVSAYLKAQGVKRGAQLWLRLDENSNSPTMNFSQPILGDTEWTRVHHGVCIGRQRVLYRRLGCRDHREESVGGEGRASWRDCLRTRPGVFRCPYACFHLWCTRSIYGSGCPKCLLTNNSVQH
jgi:hypothetical protein